MRGFNEVTYDRCLKLLNGRYRTALSSFGEEDRLFVKKGLLADMAMAYAYRTATSSAVEVFFDELAELFVFCTKEWVEDNADIIALMMMGSGRVNDVTVTDEGFDIDLWWDDELDAPPKEWWFKDELEASGESEGKEGEDD